MAAFALLSGCEPREHVNLEAQWEIDTTRRRREECLSEASSGECSAAMVAASDSASCSAVRLDLPLRAFLAASSHSRRRMSARSVSTCAAHLCLYL